MDEKMLTDDVFVADPVEERLMLGNEAVAQGAWEAGLRVAASYPGTPSTEITEFIQAAEVRDRRGIHCTWSSNEKTAMEAALGMSYAGFRSMVCMKHVGMNVAADAFVNSAMTGVNGRQIRHDTDAGAIHTAGSLRYDGLCFCPVRKRETSCPDATYHQTCPFQSRRQSGRDRA